MDREKIRIQGSASAVQNKISLPVKTKNRIMQKQRYKEAFPCVRMEASYMAETAVSLPFFVGFLMFLLFFFQILTVEQEVGNALFSAGRELSIMYCRNQEDTAGESLVAKAVFLKNLPKDSCAEQFIKGGRRGISLIKSEFTGNYIRFRAEYKIRFPIGLFGKKEIRITQNVMCRKWTGNSGQNAFEEIVYITKKGSVYHRNIHCTYLRPSIEGVSKSRVAELRNADGGKYYSCRICMKRRNENTGMVYITKYGNRYHGRKDCSRIQRTAFAVHLSEAAGKRACSKCGKE